MKTGRMLDILSGHQGPVTSLSFSPESALLASGSWDKSVRLWDVYEGRGQTDVLPHAHDVLAVAFRPDGKQVAVSTLDGQVFLWNPNDAQMQGTIEGRRDMAGGKVIGDLRSATAKASKSFKTLAYSADGAVLLAGGNGKYVCMYDVDGRALLKKFPLSKSKALDGTIERLDSNRVTDAGPMDLLPASDSEDDDEGFRRGDRGRGGAGSGGPGGSLPGAGAWNGAGSSRSSGLDVKKRPVIRCKHVTFAPTGQGWAASTTEGVMVFTRDTGAAFDPTDLGEDVTPSAARRALRHGDARLALLMSLRLKGADDDETLVAETLERVAPDAVASALRDFPNLAPRAAAGVARGTGHEGTARASDAPVDPRALRGARPGYSLGGSRRRRRRGGAGGSRGWVRPAVVARAEAAVEGVREPAQRPGADGGGERVFAGLRVRRAVGVGQGVK